MSGRRSGGQWEAPSQVTVVDAAFRAWERTELITTDRLCTRIVFWHSFLRFVLSASQTLFGLSLSWPEASLIGSQESHMWSLARMIIVLVAHMWVMSARRVWYEAHREAVVVVVRLLMFKVPIAGYVFSGAWEVSRGNVVVSRLFWGLLSTVGWHVDYLTSLVLQLTIFVMLRMGLALKVLVHDDNESWRCSPLGLCWPTSRMPAARQAELYMERGFSFSTRGLIFDFFFVVVAPALILLVKARHSRLMFEVEVHRARASRGGSGVSDARGTSRTSGVYVGHNFATINLLWERTRAWAPLLEFRDRAKEARFERWHRSHMVTADIVKCFITMGSSLAFYRRVMAEYTSPPKMLPNTLIFFGGNLLQAFVAVSNRRMYVQHRTSIMSVMRLLLFANSLLIFIGIGKVVYKQGKGADINMGADLHFILIGVVQAIGMHLLLRTLIAAMAGWGIMTVICRYVVKDLPKISEAEGVVQIFQAEKLGLTMFDWLKEKTGTEVLIFLYGTYVAITIITSVLVEMYCRRVFRVMQEGADIQHGGGRSETLGQVLSEAEPTRRSERRRRSATTRR